MHKKSFILIFLILATCKFQLLASEVHFLDLGSDGDPASGYELAGGHSAAVLNSSGVPDDAFQPPTNASFSAGTGNINWTNVASFNANPFFPAEDLTADYFLVKNGLNDTVTFTITGASPAALPFVEIYGIAGAEREVNLTFEGVTELIPITTPGATSGLAGYTFVNIAWLGDSGTVTLNGSISVGTDADEGNLGGIVIRYVPEPSYTIGILAFALSLIFKRLRKK